MARATIELTPAPPPGSGLQTAAWFSACGLPLEHSDVVDARAYVEALGISPDTAIGPVASWEHAERLIRTPSWDTRWWDIEETERRRLYDECVRQMGEHAVMARLSVTAGIESEIVHGAAAVAAAQKGVADPSLIRAAAGAASMAAYNRLLAKLSGGACDHVFVRKYALFEGGRWPLGIVGGTLYLF